MRIASLSTIAPLSSVITAAAAANATTFGLGAALRAALPESALIPSDQLEDLRLSEPIRELLDREFRDKMGGSVEHKPVDTEISKQLQILFTVARAQSLELVLLQIPASILRDGNQIRRLLVLSYVLRNKTVRLFSPDLPGEPTSAFNGLKKLWQEEENIQIEFVPMSHLEELRDGKGDLGNVLRLDALAASRPTTTTTTATTPAPAGAAAAPLTIRIFLASSQELETDRDQFDLYFRQQNDQLIKKGLYLKIERWENFLDAMSETRLQDEYNKAVRECDIFVSLFFTKTGKFTEEEFDTAHQQFEKNQKPLIYTFFKNADVKTGDISDEVLSLLNFRKKLKSLGHYQTNYNDIEHLKRQFRDQLDKLLETRGGTYWES